MRTEPDKHQVGAVLFTVRLKQLAHFYEQVVGMRIIKMSSDHVVLEIGTFRLTVHQIPEQYANNIVITSPPVVRESAATKLSFRVDSISRARQSAAELGGLVYGSEREWDNDGSRTCDGYDSDGNVFQVFQLT
jgi:predicted enzyme related to lactoylglutathione lyase